MVRKGNLVIFEGSSISGTKEVTLTKIGVHDLTSIYSCMNFLSRFRSMENFDDHGL